MMRKSILAAAAALALAGGAAIGQASAADLYVAPPPMAPPPPVFVPTWAGFYVGGHVGYGEGTSDYRQDVDIFVDDPNDVDQDNVFVELFDAGTFRDSVNPNGFLGGVQGGYNWQMNNFVLGIEGDMSFTGWDADSTVFDTDDGDLELLAGGQRIVGTSSTDIDFLASVRGRLGYAMGNVLLYGTGGVAWADGEARARITFDDGETIQERNGKGDLGDMGWVAGGGLAWMVIPQTMSVGVEGLYYWFKDSTTLIDETVDDFSRGEVDVRATAELHDAWAVRARADFHF